VRVRVCVCTGVSNTSALGLGNEASTRSGLCLRTAAVATGNDTTIGGGCVAADVPHCDVRCGAVVGLVPTAGIEGVDSI